MAKKLYQDMDYRAVQAHNTKRRKELSQEQQDWLKKNGYKNVGWTHVIKLYEKITEFLEALLEDVSLEDLFIEVDRIGNKYQTSEEIRDFHEKLAAINQDIANAIDHHFPEDEIEVYDFTQ